jgi:hypothetical protein
MKFRQWFEWGSPNEIRGEYWIEDGFVNFADADIGDQGHEGIAIDRVIGQYADEVNDLAEELEVEHEEVSPYGEMDQEAFESTLQAIREKLEETMQEHQADAYIMQQLGCDEPAYAILMGYGEARMYVMEHLGWIAVRSNNVELFGYDGKRQREIAEAIHQIFYEEGHEQEPDPSQVELSVYDHKTGKSWYVTLQDLDQPEVPFRPVQQLTTYTKPFSRKDTEENKYSYPQPGKINPWNVAARKTGLGSELWRGTSESKS